jgi:hypothetical protein
MKGEMFSKILGNTHTDVGFIMIKWSLSRGFGKHSNFYQ